MERSVLTDGDGGPVNPGALAMIAAANVVALVVFAGVQLQPRPGQPVAAWFPQGDGAAITAVAKAEGGVLSAGPLRGVIQAQSDAPDFAARLRKAGAILVLASPAGAGCAPIQATAS